MTVGIRLWRGDGVLRFSETARVIRLLGSAVISVPGGSGLYLVGVGSIAGVEWGVTDTVDSTSAPVLRSTGSVFKWDATTIAMYRNASTRNINVYLFGY